MSRRKLRPENPAEETYEWLRPHEIMAQYGIGKTRLYELLASGEIPSAKIGRTRHVRRSDMERYFDQRIRA